LLPQIESITRRTRKMNQSDVDRVGEWVGKRAGAGTGAGQNQVAVGGIKFIAM